MRGGDPQKLNKTQREALKKFEGTLKEENYEKRKGFFKKLKDMPFITADATGPKHLDMTLTLCKVQRADRLVWSIAP